MCRYEIWEVLFDAGSYALVEKPVLEATRRFQGAQRQELQG
jgi:hypothetical protein